MKHGRNREIWDKKGTISLAAERKYFDVYSTMKSVFPCGNVVLTF